MDGDQLELLHTGDQRHRGPVRGRSGNALADLPEEHRDLFLKGTGGDKLYVTYRNRMNRKRSYMLAFEGIVPSLEALP